MRSTEGRVARPSAGSQRSAPNPARAMAGWTRVEMIRYARATAGERAAAKARRLDLGN
jgi:hypothetical protein